MEDTPIQAVVAVDSGQNRAETATDEEESEPEVIQDGDNENMRAAPHSGKKSGQSQRQEGAPREHPPLKTAIGPGSNNLH